jgi:23S rRNA-/tRNA-specific pseudouridylate synthase
MRLDQAIPARFPSISRRKARELIASGCVTVNQRSIRVASREVAEGDELRVVDAQPPVPLLASTEEWLAVNKTAGVPAQPARDRATLSLEEMLRIEYRSIYLVHRLDTPTSGVMLFARTAAAAARLSTFFANGTVRKIYLARVHPPIDHEMTIDTPIDGKEALTIVSPRGDGLVEVDIRTGRTHQIRIHLSGAGHPVDGDRRYGGKPARRLMLHAWRLEHPELGVIEAPPDAALRSG